MLNLMLIPVDFGRSVASHNGRTFLKILLKGNLCHRRHQSQRQICFLCPADNRTHSTIHRVSLLHDTNSPDLSFWSILIKKSPLVQLTPSVDHLILTRNDKSTRMKSTGSSYKFSPYSHTCILYLVSYIYMCICVYVYICMLVSVCKTSRKWENYIRKWLFTRKSVQIFASG